MASNAVATVATTATPLGSHSGYDTVRTRKSQDYLAEEWVRRSALHDTPTRRAGRQQTVKQSICPRSNHPLKLTAPVSPRRTLRGDPIRDSNGRLYKKLINELARTRSPSEGWEAYSALLHLPCAARQRAGLPNISFYRLHRFSRLLARIRPRTRNLFLRLLSVLRTIRASGGIVHLDEWNALVDSAGRGWRKTRTEDLKAAMDIYNDMVFQRAPGATLSENFALSPVQAQTSSPSVIVKPDIVTYTTLLSIAGRTMQSPAVHHATSLLKGSGIAPNRITHLTLLRFFARTNQLPGVYSTLLKMKEQGFQLGLDGLNACLFAFSRNDRLDVAFMIYRILRHHVVPEPQDDIAKVIDHLSHMHDITVPEDLVPDKITYITMVQNLAYSGYLVPALEIFADLLAFMDVGTFTSDEKFAALVPAFRGVFLGFARHAQPPLSDHPRVPTRGRLLPSRAEESAWTAENLDRLFQDYLTLSGSVRPSRATLYWIMVSFQKTNSGDVVKLRRVWSQLEEKFPGPWTGPNHRLERLRKRLFDGQSTRIGPLPLP